MSWLHLLKFKVGSQASRVETARMLGALKYEQAVPHLIKALNDHSDWLRETAASTLGEIGAATAVEPLIAALDDEDSMVAMRAAEALGKIGDKRAVEPLLDSLHKLTSFSFLRSTVVTALGEIGDASATEPLIGELNDNRASETAAKALGKIGDVRAVAPLLAALKDDDEFIRMAAAEALGEIGDKRACDGLREAIRDAQDRVRKVAAKAIKKIGDECSGSALPAISALLAKADTSKPEEKSAQYNFTRGNMPHILSNLYLCGAFFTAYIVFSLGLALWVYAQFDLAINNASTEGVIIEYIRDDVVEEYDGRRSAVVWEMRYQYVVNDKHYFGMEDFKEGTRVGEKVNVVFNVKSPSQHFVGDGGAVKRAVAVLVAFLVITYIVGKELISSWFGSWHEWCIWRRHYVWNSTGWRLLVLVGGVFFVVVGLSVGSAFAELVSSINWLSGYRWMVIICGAAAYAMLFVMRRIYESVSTPANQN